MEAEDAQFQSNSKLAALVESNCEFLTNIRHNVSQRTEIARKSYKTLEDYMKDRKCRLNTEALLQLFIELAYFLYACKTYHVTPLIDLIDFKDFRVEETSLRNSEKRFSVVIWYKVEEMKMQQGQAVERFLTAFQYIQEVIALEDYLRVRRDQRDGSKSQLQQQQMLETFRSQLKMLAGNSFFRQRESLFFLCLEQTALFYEMSLLYRIKNCSIMDYMKIDENRFNIFRVSRVKDQSLVIEYNKQKSRGKGDAQYLKAKEKEIQNNIKHFFKSINEKYYFQFPSKSQKESGCRVKFNYVVREREKYAFEEMLQSMQGANVFRNDSKRLMECKRIPSQAEYYIEYSSDMDQICVRLYILSLTINQDFLVFQSNVFNFQNLNISIQLTEPKLKGVEKSNRKVLTFKGSSSFNQKQPILEKILLLIDITMIASKIYEPELDLSKVSPTTGKDYQKLSTIAKKISHYTKLYLKCARKIYSE